MLIPPPRRIGVCTTLLIVTLFVSLGGSATSLASTQTKSSNQLLRSISSGPYAKWSPDDVTPADFATVSFPDNGDDGAKLDKRRPGAYLIDTSKAAAKPQLQIAYYDATDGLLASYQAYSGKRILLRAVWMNNGAVNAEVAHLDQKSNRVEIVMGSSKRINPGTGQRSTAYDVAGVPILSHLREVSSNSYTNHQSADTLSQFVRSDVGQAVAEAIPALYVALESLEDDAGKLAQLQAPFGGLLTALQLSTTVFTGFEQSDAILGRALANSLRNACQLGECQYRGRHFTVQSNGLFDVLSKSRTSTGNKVTQLNVPAAQRSLSQKSVDRQKEGDGTCVDRTSNDFGYCGLGTTHPGNIQTPQCYAHDLCVCKYDTWSCLVNTPAPCDDCASLIVAIWSYLESIFGGNRPKVPDEDEGGPGESIPDWWTT